MFEGQPEARPAQGHAADPATVARRERWTRTAVAATILVAIATAAATPTAAQRLEVEVRAGMAASSALVEDRIAGPGALAALGIELREDGETRQIFPVHATPRIGPMAVVAARAWLSPDLAVELSLGRTSTDLVGRAGGGTWTIQSLEIEQWSAGLRGSVANRLHIRGSGGQVVYRGGGTGLFRDGDESVWHWEAGAGAHWRTGPFKITVEAVGQTHRFATRAMRADGGSDGRVVRGALLVGLSLGTGGR